MLLEAAGLVPVQAFFVLGPDMGCDGSDVEGRVGDGSGDDVVKGGGDEA